MESQCALGQALFGPSYMGFFALSFGLHLTTAALAGRVARQLGTGLHGATATGLIYLSRYAIIDGIFWCSDFFYVSAAFFYALAVSFFPDFLSGRSRARQLASSVCFVAALMSCEFALTPPAILLLIHVRARALSGAGAWRLAGDDVTSALAALWPHLVVTAVYVPFRYLVDVYNAKHSYYTYSISGKTAGQALMQLGWISGPGFASWVVALAILAAAGLLLSGSAERRSEAVRFLWPLCGICGVWIVANALPFIGLVYPHSRFSMPLVLPAALLVGAFVHAAFQGQTKARTPWLEAAVLATAALSLPYAALTRHAAEPAWRPARYFAEFVAALPPEMRVDRKIAVAYDGPGMGGPDAGAAFRRAVQDGALLPVVFPGDNARFELAPVGDAALGPARCPRCEYFQLMPDLSLRPWAGPAETGGG